MNMLRGVHYAFTFLLELAMLAALAWGGYHLGRSPFAAVALGIVLPGAVIVFWGLFLAPRAGRRLPPPWLQLLRLLCFEAAAALLFAAGAATAAVILALAGLVNVPGAFYFDRSGGPV
jgi:hypothetical protein